MAMKPCRECKKEISTDAKTCPNCGKKNPTKGPSRIVLFGGGFVLLLIVVGQFGGKNRQSGDSSTSVPSAISASGGSDIARGARQELAASLPQEQASFIAVIESAKEPYAAAPNELKKSAIRTQRAASIKAALGGRRKIAAWVGMLTSMRTTGDGKAYIVIEIAPGLRLKTWNNALSDVSDNTLISQSGSLFAAISDLKEGDSVEFSGVLLASEQDFVREASLSETGSISRPEFIVRFSDIKKR